MKNIALYGLQMMVGLVAILAGYSAFIGAESIVQLFHLIGLSQGSRMLFAAAEIAAGLFLLFPRSGLVGAALLTCVMVGVCGVAIGHAVSRTPVTGTAVTYRAVETPGGDFVAPAAPGARSREWRI